MADSEYRTSHFEVTIVRPDRSEAHLINRGRNQHPRKFYTRTEADKEARERANETGRKHKVYMVHRTERAVGEFEPVEEEEE